MIKKKNKIKLGVNIDHAATLRQVRGGSTTYPDLLQLCHESMEGGAEQITIHLREDRRHIQLQDLQVLAAKCPVPLNLEMAATDEMVRLAKKHKPSWVCFVPEKRQELTTEGGLDVFKQLSKLKKYVEKLQPVGIEISMFIEPSLQQVQASYDVGADAIELHTGKWVALQGTAKQKEWNRLKLAALKCHALGMRVHAGHGLDYAHAKKIRGLPHLQEVNIGHSLICYSLQDGLRRSVQKMQKALLGHDVK
ncbi:MAG: pyridoxine 5'-phosphate synthase [Pseudobdellovibrionaceae bacterium]